MMHNPHLDQLGHLDRAAHVARRAHPDRLLFGPGPHLGASGRPPLPEPEDRSTCGAQYRVASPGGPRWRQVERERGRGRIQYIFGHTDGQTGFLSFVRPQDGDAVGLVAA